MISMSSSDSVRREDTTRPRIRHRPMEARETATPDHGRALTRSASPGVQLGFWRSSPGHSAPARRPFPTLLVRISGFPGHIRGPTDPTCGDGCRSRNDLRPWRESVGADRNSEWCAGRVVPVVVAIASRTESGPGNGSCGQLKRTRRSNRASSPVRILTMVNSAPALDSNSC